MALLSLECSSSRQHYLFRAGDPVGERLGRVAAETEMLLMLCDQSRWSAVWPRGRSARRGRREQSRACGWLLPGPVRGARGDPADDVITP